MTHCIIHIGMHKTGSTSIQNSLRGFSNGRFVYANLDASNHSLAMYSLFATRPELHHLHKGREDAVIQAYIAKMRADLERSIEAARDRTLIISGEDISVLPQIALVEMHKYFHSRFDHVRIVGYVRPPAGYFASAFQEQVKGGSAGKFNFERIYPNYRRTFGKFDEVFGRENVDLWKFDPQSFPVGCAVQDFCSRLSISLPLERIVRLNESLPQQVVALLYTYRIYGQELGSNDMKAPESMKLGNMLAVVGNDKFRFSPGVIGSVLEKNRADIEWMEARLGQSLDENLGEHRLSDVRDESDLLHPNPEVVKKLLEMLGNRAPVGVVGRTPMEVALLMHALRGKSVSKDMVKKSQMKATEWDTDRKPSKREDTRMEVTELIARMRQTDPKLLAGIPENNAAALIRNVFKQMNDTLAVTDKRVVNYVGLGQFRVRKVEREVKGEKITRTQINFRRA